MKFFADRSTSSRSIPNYTVLSLIACGLAMAWPGLLGHGAELEDAPAWRQLTLVTGGKVAEGWRQVGWGGFVVDDGALRTECDPRGLGLLVYEKERFGNCQIRVVFKSKDAKSNAGVHVRIADGILEQFDRPGVPISRGADGTVSPESVRARMASAEREEGPWFAVHRGYEVQIMDENDPLHRTGAIYSFAPSSATASKSPGEWRTMVITLAGEKIFVDLDGLRVTSFDSRSREVSEAQAWFDPKREPKRPEAGYIGLQNHFPGDVVWFKEVSVRKLADAASVKDLKLKVSANGRYFVDQRGKPFFYLGDTCWLVFQRPNREEVEEYLKDRAAKGFTVIQAYVIRGLGKQHPDGNFSFLGATPFIDRDPTRPNEEFFRNVDYVVNRANELGLVMGLVTAKSWHVNQHPEKVFDEKNAYVFGKFLGERYKNNAVLWYPGGDSPPGRDEAIWVAMARGLKDGCGGTQLVSYHGQGSTSSSQWFHKADWLDFNSIQSGHHFGSDSYAFVSKDYALTPAKPTVEMEPAYENHPTGAGQPRIDAHKVRTQAYSAMLAGAAGHGYGSLDLFYFYKDADGPFPKNGFQHWRKAIAYEGSRQVGLMRRLFEERPWYRLIHDQSVLASEPGGGPYRLVAARADDGSCAIAYTPRGQSLIIRMDRLVGTSVKAQWYDPREGKWSVAGQHTNQGKREFVPPSRGEKDDWVLVLDAVR